MEKKSLKYWKIFAFIMIALNITLIVLLILGSPKYRHKGNDPGKYLIEKLKFTELQKAAFDKLREEHHSSIMNLQFEGRKLRKSLFDGLQSDPPNTNCDTIVNKIAENQKQIELITLKHFAEVKKLCNAEQKVTFNDIIEEVIENIGNKPPDEPKGHKGRN
jgi:hypothetical protein